MAAYAAGGAKGESGNRMGVNLLFCRDQEIVREPRHQEAAVSPSERHLRFVVPMKIAPPVTRMASFRESLRKYSSSDREWL